MRELHRHDVTKLIESIRHSTPGLEDGQELTSVIADEKIPDTVFDEVVYLMIFTAMITRYAARLETRVSELETKLYSTETAADNNTDSISSLGERVDDLERASEE